MSSNIEWTKKYTNEWALEKQCEISHRSGSIEGSLEEKIFQIIRLNEGASFVNLKEGLGNEMKGNFAFTLKNYQNIVLWINVNAEFSDTINKMIEEKIILYKLTSIFTYLADGGGLQMPVAKGLKQYKTPRWLPVAFYTYMFKKPSRQSKHTFQK
jgi:hypothetical protein